MSRLVQRRAFTLLGGLGFRVVVKAPVLGFRVQGSRFRGLAQACWGFALLETNMQLNPHP